MTVGMTVIPGLFIWALTMYVSWQAYSSLMLM